MGTMVYHFFACSSVVGAGSVDSSNCWETPGLAVVLRIVDPGE